MSYESLLNTIYICMIAMAVLAVVFVVWSDNPLMARICAKNGNDPVKCSKMAAVALLWIGISCLPTLLSITAQNGWLILGSIAMMLPAIIVCGILESHGKLK